MYDELKKELRLLDERSKQIYPTPSGIFKEAADAIDRLEKEVQNWKITAAEEASGLEHWFENYNADDVVEIVRCKDCIYSPSGDDNGESQGFSLEWPHDDWPECNPCPYKCADGWYSRKPEPEFYCKKGKRKEN